jgi:hypothetical protein
MSDQIKGIFAASLEQDLEKLAQLADRDIKLQQPTQVFAATATSSSHGTITKLSTPSLTEESTIAEIQREIAILSSRLTNLTVISTVKEIVTEIV